MSDQAHIKSSIERSIRAMELRPSLARAHHVGTAVVDADGLGCTFSDGKHDIRLDVPPAVGGGGSAPSPGAMSRAALAGCVAIGLKMIASLRGVPVEGVEVDLEVDADNRADFGMDDVPAGYEAFRVSIRVESAADPEVVRAVVEESLKVSAVLDAHQRAQDVSTSIEIVAPSTSSLDR